MKQFIDKLIERLEEEKEIAEKEMEECIFKALPYHDSTEGRVIGINNAISIVNQLAEEYADKNCSECTRRKWYQIGYADAEKKLAEEYNGGWISLEEKLPNCGSAILILLKNKSDGITMDDGTTCDISWLRTEDYFISSQGKYKYEDVTHWQPLPYQPKGQAND